MIFDLILGRFFTLWGPNEFFLGPGLVSKTVLGFTHVVDQLLFSIVPSILTFDFKLFWGHFWLFLGPNELFLGRGWFQNCFVVYSCS